MDGHLKWRSLLIGHHTVWKPFVLKPFIYEVLCRPDGVLYQNHQRHRKLLCCCMQFSRIVRRLRDSIFSLFLFSPFSLRRPPFMAFVLLLLQPLGHNIPNNIFRQLQIFLQSSPVQSLATKLFVANWLNRYTVVRNQLKLSHHENSCMFIILANNRSKFF